MSRDEPGKGQEYHFQEKAETCRDSRTEGHVVLNNISVSLLTLSLKQEVWRDGAGEESKNLVSEPLEPTFHCLDSENI